MNSAVIATPKLEEDFYDWWARHEEKCRLAQAHPHDVVFIGDSITHLFEWEPVENRGKSIWQAEIAPFQALNLGFGWDRTGNVLWRLQNGELAGQTPKLAVLLIGTNNLATTANYRANTPLEIYEGIEAVCEQIHALTPQTDILIQGLFPRSPAGDPLRHAVTEVNRLLPALHNPRARRHVYDFSGRFLQPDGTLPTTVMDDLVHPTTAGYRIWADAILPELRRFLPL